MKTEVNSNLVNLKNSDSDDFADDVTSMSSIDMIKLDSSCMKIL